MFCCGLWPQHNELSIFENEVFFLGAVKEDISLAAYILRIVQFVIQLTYYDFKVYNLLLTL